MPLYAKPKVRSLCARKNVPLCWADICVSSQGLALQSSVGEDGRSRSSATEDGRASNCLAGKHNMQFIFE